MRLNRMTLALAAIALAACTSSPAGTSGPPTTGVDATPAASTTTSQATGEVIELKDARLKFEINSTDLDGGVQVFIDADLWKEMSIFDPSGLLIFNSTTEGRMAEQGGTELFLESAEPPFTELPIEGLLERFPAGEYTFRGVGLNGEPYLGTAQLTHDIPAGPKLVAPLEGDGPQDPDHTTVVWETVEPPNGSPIIGYQVLVVQPDTGLVGLPKIVVDVMMPPTATSMLVPPGFLLAGTEYEWEVLAIEESGNQTLSSDFFTTAGESSFPSFDQLTPADFVPLVDTPYFPKLSGMSWVYEGATDEGQRRTESRVLTETIEILGITATVVRNQDYLDGVLTEDNLDYYAQDKDGNVWYLGENVDNYQDGVLHDHAGSWLAGDDGAIPGIVMPAQPGDHLGQTYRQEQRLESPLDRAAVISVTESVTVPAGSFEGVVQTHDTSAVELDLNEHKFYAQGVGHIKTIDLESGDEFVLLEYTT